MAITTTGSKYSSTLTSVGTTTVTDTAATFLAADFYAQRIVGLWTTGYVYKGMAWVKTWSSATVLNLESEFLDKNGAVVTQVVGDRYYVSKNFADVSGTGYTLVSNLVTTPQLIFGSNTNPSYSVCFYDEFKEVYINSVSGGPPAMQLLGGLVVFGHLLDYASGAVTGDVCINCTAAPSSGTTGQVLEFSGSAQGMKFAMFGGSLIAGGSGGAGHIGPGDAGYASEWCKFWNVTVSSDMVSPGGGAAWAANAASHETRDLRSYCSGQYAINLRWADGTISGGSYIATAGSQSAANLALSIFGSDAAGTFTIAAPYPKRLQAIANPRDCLWRANSAVTQTINYTNVLSAFHSTMVGLGPGPQTAATQYFYFTGVFSTLTDTTVATIKADADSSLEDSYTVGPTGLTDAMTILRETKVSDNVPTIRGPWTAAFFSYLHNIMSFAVATTNTQVRENAVPDVVFGGPLAQAIDQNITQTTQATVDAYTTIDDLSMLYDRAKSYKVTLANVLYPTYTTQVITANGNIIDLATQNLTINSGAGSAFAVTTGSSLVTIKSTTFTTSNLFDTLKVNTSYTLTLTSAAMTCNLNLSGNASVPSISSLTGTVTVTGGTLTFNGYNSAALIGSANATATIIIATSTANGDVWDFRSFTFNSATILRNTSGYNIIAKLLPGQTQPTKQETSGTITFDSLIATTLTVTGVTQNTQCWIYTGSVELMNTTATTLVSGNSYQATAAYNWSVDTAVTIRAREKGYLLFETTGTVTSSGLTITAIWLVDSNWKYLVSGTDITFTTPTTITRASGNFTTDGWLSVMGQVTVEGSNSNDGTYTLSAVGTTTLTITGATLTSEGPSSGITLTFTRIALT